MASPRYEVLVIQSNYTYAKIYIILYINTHGIPNNTDTHNERRFGPMSLFIQKSFGEKNAERGDAKIKRRPIPVPPPNQYELSYAAEGRKHVTRVIMHKYTVPEPAVVKELAE
jgi:hypothetical protein